MSERISKKTLDSGLLNPAIDLSQNQQQTVFASTFSVPEELNGYHREELYGLNNPLSQIDKLTDRFNHQEDLSAEEYFNLLQFVSCQVGSYLEGAGSHFLNLVAERSLRGVHIVLFDHPRRSSNIMSTLSGGRELNICSEQIRIITDRLQESFEVDDQNNSEHFWKRWLGGKETTPPISPEEIKAISRLYAVSHEYGHLLASLFAEDIFRMASPARLPGYYRDDGDTFFKKLLLKNPNFGLIGSLRPDAAIANERFAVGLSEVFTRGVIKDLGYEHLQEKIINALFRYGVETFASSRQLNVLSFTPKEVGNIGQAALCLAGCDGCGEDSEQSFSRDKSLVGSEGCLGHKSPYNVDELNQILGFQIDQMLSPEEFIAKKSSNYPRRFLEVYPDGHPEIQNRIAKMNKQP